MTALHVSVRDMTVLTAGWQALGVVEPQPVPAERARHDRALPLPPIARVQRRRARPLVRVWRAPRQTAARQTTGRQTAGRPTAGRPTARRKTAGRPVGTGRALPLKYNTCPD